jgi:hypothetical protein
MQLRNLVKDFLGQSSRTVPSIYSICSVILAVSGFLRSQWLSLKNREHSEEDLVWGACVHRFRTFEFWDVRGASFHHIEDLLAAGFSAQR